MNVCVIGSDGYVGSVLCFHLRSCGVVVSEVDARWFSYSENSPRMDARQCVNYVDLSDFDAVVYLAAVSNDPMGHAFERPTMEINATACVDIAAAAKQAGVKSFVFASSCSVYGTAVGDLRSESDSVNPLTAYARSKIYAEKQLAELETDKFNITALRFATACGASPRLRLDLVLNDFVASAVTTKRINILSNGKPFRPLIAVPDMARAIEWAIFRRDSGFLAVNCGAKSWNFQIADLAEAVREVIPGTVIEINHEATTDPRSYKVDFSLYERIAPDHQPICKLTDTIKGLEEQITALKLNPSQDFRTLSPFSRLTTLKNHISSGSMDAQLSWID